VRGPTALDHRVEKTEITIPAPASGILREWRCQPGHVVKAGQVVALIEESTLSKL
jgi:biotin carboxyl carrier protein